MNRRTERDTEKCEQNNTGKYKNQHLCTRCDAIQFSNADFASLLFSCYPVSIAVAAAAAAAAAAFDVVESNSLK